MRYPFYDDLLYKRKQSQIIKKYYALHPRIRVPITRTCNNSNCKLPFQIVQPSDPKIYCSQSCAASVNNRIRKRFKRLPNCINCVKTLNRSCSQYCSIKCQNTFRFNLYISQWKQGSENGNRGITTRILSAHLRHYLFEKFDNKCSSCGWNRKHPKTLVVPLEVNHIDGNAENNKEENLELLCPNCHALTPNFRNLNKGKGRSWRLFKIAQARI